MGRKRVTADRITQVLQERAGLGLRFNYILSVLHKRGFKTTAQSLIENLTWLLAQKTIVKIASHYGIVKDRGDGTGYLRVRGIINDPTILFTCRDGAVVEIGEFPLPEMKVSKVIETKVYGAIYTVALPVRFFFNKDDSYDGIEVHVEGALERDQELVKELMVKLSEAEEKEHE